jgi:hypothetical protein
MHKLTGMGAMKDASGQVPVESRNVQATRTASMTSPTHKSELVIEVFTCSEPSAGSGRPQPALVRMHRQRVDDVRPVELGLVAVVVDHLGGDRVSVRRFRTTIG